MKTVCIALCAALLWACGCDASTKPVFVFELRVLTDAGDPVAGAMLSRDGQGVGVTDARGVHLLQMAGDEGQRVRFAVQCPSGYRPNTTAQEAAMRRVTTLQKGQRTAPHVVALQCLPTLRRGVLVVRVSGVTPLPVLVDGKLVAHTSEHGVAHVPLSLIPESSVRVSLDTSALPKLGPASPSQRFVIEDRDAVLVFDQALSELKLPRRRARRGPKREVPYRLD